MNRPNRTLYLPAVLAVAALVATSCGRADGRPSFRGRQEATATINRAWPAGAIQRVNVFEIDGNVSVEAVEGDQITLVATARGDLEKKAGAENEGLFETTIEGDTLRIGRKKEKRHGFDIPIFFGRDEMRINYELRVPASMELDVNTINGRIEGRGLEGETEASTINGTIDIETSGAHGLYATTVNGQVKARFTRSFHGAKFKTVNGGVTATLPQSASFNVDLSQVNGDFEAAFPLSIHSNPGSRRVSGEVNGGEHELRIVTVNGDVELARLSNSL